MDVVFFLRRQLDYMSSFSSSADMHQVITFLINAKNLFNFRLGNFLNFIKNVAKPFPMIRITPLKNQSAETSLAPPRSDILVHQFVAARKALGRPPSKH